MEKSTTKCYSKKELLTMPGLDENDINIKSFLDYINNFSDNTRFFIDVD